MLTIQNCMLNRVGLRLLSGERNEPPQPEYFDAQWGFMRSLPCPQGYNYGYGHQFPIRFKNDWCGGCGRLCLWGARGSKLFLSLLVQSPIFRHFFSRTFPTGLQHDIHHRSPRQIIIHSEHENSRVGQIASRSDRDRQGHSIRRAAQPAPFTTHFCSSHTCPSSFDQLRPACPSLAGISPVSRSISPVSHRD
jgi:hypothetical protein